MEIKPLGEDLKEFIDIPENSTVINACEIAHQQNPDIDWIHLAKNKRVRVNYRDYSNAETENGYYGSILTTPLSAGDIVLIFNK